MRSLSAPSLLCAWLLRSASGLTQKRDWKSIWDPITEGLVESSIGAVQGILGDGQVFDYVVVGGGTAGNTMGYRLAEAGFKVAIVERGLSYEIEKPIVGAAPFGDIIGVGKSSGLPCGRKRSEFIPKTRLQSSRYATHR